MAILSGWRKAYQALHVCVSPHSPSAGGDGTSFFSEEDPDTVPHHISNSSDGISSSTISLPAPSISNTSIPAKNLLAPRFASKVFGIRASKSTMTSTCAICLETMKPGHGHALFTAECSHTFHFSCIASNVSYGNLVCPVCRATWKEVPCQALLVNRHRLGSRSSSSTYRNTTPPPQQPVASTHGIGYGELPALIREHDEQRPSRYSLKPVLRRLDESIARFQAAQATEKQIKAEEREGGRYDDDEELLYPAVTMADHQASSSLLPSKRAGDGDGSGSGSGRKPAMEITALAEESEVCSDEARESMAILIHLRGAGARDEEKQLAKILQGRGGYDSGQPRRWGASAVDLIAVLDVSRSMEGTKLGLLKRAMAMVVRSLGCADRLSIVAFSARARRVMALRRMTEGGKRAAMEAVNALACTGGTAISEGLRKSSEILKQRRFKNPVATVMLLSDGQDGSTSPTSRTDDESGRLPSHISKRSSAIAMPSPSSSSPSVSSSTSAARVPLEIPVHTFALQSQSDHSQPCRHGTLLQSISEESGGSSFTFDVLNCLHSTEASHGDGDGELLVTNNSNNSTHEESFAQSLGSLLSVVALQVQIDVKVNPHISSRAEILGMEIGDEGGNPSSFHSSATSSCLTIAAGRHIRVSLGDLYAHEERELLLHVRLPVVSSSEASGTTLINPRNDSSSAQTLASSGTSEALMAVYCRYTDPNTGASLQTAPTQVLLHRTPSQLIAARKKIDNMKDSGILHLSDRLHGPDTGGSRGVSDHGMAVSEADRHRNRLRAARAIWEAMAMAGARNMAGAVHRLEMAREAMQRGGGELWRAAMEAELERVQESMSMGSRRRMQRRSLVHNHHIQIHVHNRRAEAEAEAEAETEAEEAEEEEEEEEEEPIGQH